MWKFFDLGVNKYSHKFAEKINPPLQKGANQT